MVKEEIVEEKKIADYDNARLLIEHLPVFAFKNG
jgi:hypothetical protein